MWVIKDWEKVYESADSRKIRNLTWVRIPNSHGGRGYRRLMRHQDGILAFSCFVLMVQVASRMPQRGVLTSQDGVLTSQDMEELTFVSSEYFERAFKLLSSKDIGWVEWRGAEPYFPARQDGVPARQDGVPARPQERRGDTHTQETHENSSSSGSSRIGTEPTKAAPLPPLSKEEWERPDPHILAHELAVELAVKHWRNSDVKASAAAIGKVLGTAIDQEKVVASIRRTHRKWVAAVASERKADRKLPFEANKNLAYWISDLLYLQEPQFGETDVAPTSGAIKTWEPPEWMRQPKAE